MDVILKYTLKKIQEQTSLIPNLNRGGCCHFAKLLAKELEQRNIKFKTSLMDWNSSIPQKVNRAVRNREDYLFGNSHVAIKIGKYYIDGEDTSSNPNDLYEGEVLNTTLTYKDVKFYANNYYWNSAFNKRKYHSIISKIIKEQFKIYDKLQNDRK